MNPRPPLELAIWLCVLPPRVVRLDAGSWSRKLIASLPGFLAAIAVIPWNPERQTNREGLPPTWTAAELALRTRIEQFSSHVLVFRLQRPPVLGWSAVETRVAPPFAATWVIALPPGKRTVQPSSACQVWFWPMFGKRW